MCNWYIDVQDPPGSYRVDLGYVADNDKFFCIARSNTVCVVADVLQPLEALRILNVSVDRNDQVLIDWLYSANADVDTLTLIRTADTSGTSLAINNVMPPGQDSTRIIDESADVRSRSWFYQFSAVDACDNRLQSNILSTIHLDV